ncbi:transcription termination factor NusA [Ligilactobacillus ceti]|uniref:Transcription termination/antitermination protein NusA n=1 Tax=Ligilactobacillus ceti DSM 22408 TaxID=1122146 RepID=A0A0R2KGY9_9LACO|nr:transcription termination factor NusA [Ligilactobacillus ceti]KRN88623.1 transcription elongation factor NusA [Ligilactobacillus ceti DSM 22408]
MSKELLRALDALEAEKGVDKEIMIEALQAALVSAYKRNYDKAQNVEVEFDRKKGNINVYAVKEVVTQVFDPLMEVSLEDALAINKAYEVGDVINFEVTPANFGRIAAQTAKQVIMQRVREAERSVIYNQFIEYKDEIVTGEIERQDSRNGNIYVSLGNVEAVLMRKDQIPGEIYKPQTNIKVYVSQVENETKGPQVFVSRAHEDLLKRLFEAEVPELYDGTVEIMSIAREAGDRAKVSVRSNNPDLDPVGTCVGPRGQRVQVIVNELKGENMDIVEWSQDPATFIANALNPADVIEVVFDANNEKACTVYVPNDQLSLAIGKKGQNVRLAARLTGYKIDIKPVSEMNAAPTEVISEEEVTTELENDMPVDVIEEVTEASDMIDFE